MAALTNFPNGISAGTVKIGTGGTSLKGMTVYTPSLTPAQVAANETAEQTFTVTGVASTDTVLTVSKPTAQAGLGIVGWRVSAQDTVAVTYVNATAAPITPTASETYSIVVLST